MADKDGKSENITDPLTHRQGLVLGDAIASKNYIRMHAAPWWYK